MISIPQGGGAGSNHGGGPGGFISLPQGAGTSSHGGHGAGGGGPSGLRIDCSLTTPSEAPSSGGSGGRHDRRTDSGSSSSSGLGPVPMSPGGSSWEDAMTQLSRELQVSYSPSLDQIDLFRVFF